MATKGTTTIPYRLIEETIRQANEFGFDHLSLRKIASKCGVTHSTVYKHFANKQNLLESIFPYIWARFYPFIDQELQNAPQNQQFLALTTGYARYMLDHPEQYQYFVTINPYSSATHPANTGELISGYFKRYAGIIFDYFKLCGIPEQETVLIMSLYVSILNGLLSLMIRGLVVYRGDIKDLLDHMILKKLHLQPSE